MRFEAIDDKNGQTQSETTRSRKLVVVTPRFIAREASPRTSIAWSALSFARSVKNFVSRIAPAIRSRQAKHASTTNSTMEGNAVKSTVSILFSLFMLLSLSLFSQAQTAPSTAAPSSTVLATPTSIVPRLVSYSGKLSEDQRKGISAVVGITFSVYKDQEGGSPLWLETQNVTPDSTGRYTVPLGNTLPDGLPLDLFSSGEGRWLGVRVNGGSEQSRVLLFSVPYALKAADSETLGGLPATAFMLAAPVAGSTGSASNVADSPTGSAVAPVVTITGSGTLNFLPIFTGTSMIGNSALFQSGSGTMAKIGINTSAPASALDVKGNTTLHGILTLPTTGTATSSGAKNSQPQNLVASAFNSSSSTAENETFRWQAEPTGNNTISPSATLNLLFGKGSANPTETGLKIASNGQITFASGQTFPGGVGGGTVTSVGLSAPSSDFTVSGSPVTKSGTLALKWTVAPTSVATANAIVKRDGNGLINAQGVISNNPNGVGLVANSSGNAGILGGSSTNVGVWGTSLSGHGVYGQTGTLNVGIGADYGVYGHNLGVNGIGVRGDTSGNTGIGVSGFAEIGVEGDSASIDGTGAGVVATGRAGSAALYATTGTGGPAVNANNTGTGTGILANSLGFAGFFNGNVQIDGNLSKDSGSFMIDHPLDPANKYLYHSFVESPDMMNIYNGNVTTNSTGDAVVTLPDWFETLNRDFRYQLTVMGQFAQAIVASKLASHKFTIKTDKPNIEVSWQITGIRHDAWANAHRIPLEEDKPANERGFYKHPELYGAPEEKSILWAREPNAMKQWKETRLKMAAEVNQASDKK